MRGGKKVVIEPHRHEGVFICRGKEDALVTRNMVPGEAVYGEKRVSVEVSCNILLIYLYKSPYIAKLYCYISMLL